LQKSDLWTALMTMLSIWQHLLYLVWQELLGSRIAGLN